MEALLPLHMPQAKLCRKCLVYKDWDEFGKRSREKDGKNYYCIPCTVQQSAESYQRNRPARLQQAFEYRQPRKEEAKAYQKDYRTKNKDMLAAKLVENRESYLARRRKWNAANRDKQYAYEAAHKAESKERHAANYVENRERILARNAAWFEANPGQKAEIARKRRAQKKQAPLNDLTHAQWLEIQAAQDHRCWYCQKRCKGKLTQDHIQPLSQGGSHTLHNVIGACISCNSKKHDGPPLVPVQPLLLSIAPSRKPKKKGA